MARLDPNAFELEEQVIFINRVSKVTKGGKNLSFSVLAAVGDREGHVGVGKGKAQDVADAIRKATEAAKKALIEVPITEDGTIPHPVIGEFGASKVLLRPAAPGTGVVAGGGAKIVLDLAGVRNVLAKCLGSSNPYNLVKATLEGLKSLRTPQEVARRRGVEVDRLSVPSYGMRGKDGAFGG
ncbi:MAG: 30S ribosomal protein S5 [Candidatus Latescibacterota bacterium]|nr:MAG: 30S ribosomal protein S5 [Candidatus Latescibacterota bacterium]HDI00010.1 30S ribosomal protein S5 [Bacillota bacterium]